RLSGRITVICLPVENESCLGLPGQNMPVGDYRWNELPRLVTEGKEESRARRYSCALAIVDLDADSGERELFRGCSGYNHRDGLQPKDAKVARAAVGCETRKTRRQHPAGGSFVDRTS